MSYASQSASMNLYGLRMAKNYDLSVGRTRVRYKVCKSWEDKSKI